MRFADGSFHFSDGDKVDLPAGIEVYVNQGSLGPAVVQYKLVLVQAGFSYGLALLVTPEADEQVFRKRLAESLNWLELKRRRHDRLESFKQRKRRKQQCDSSPSSPASA